MHIIHLYFLQILFSYHLMQVQILIGQFYSLLCMLVQNLKLIFLHVHVRRFGSVVNVANESFEGCGFESPSGSSQPFPTLKGSMREYHSGEFCGQVKVSQKWRPLSSCGQIRPFWPHRFDPLVEHGWSGQTFLFYILNTRLVVCNFHVASFARCTSFIFFINIGIIFIFLGPVSFSRYRNAFPVPSVDTNICLHLNRDILAFPINMH